MRLFAQHPKSFWIIAFGIMWNTFSYYGTQTILVLYLMHVFQLNRTNSYLLYGAYAAFIYATPLLGGVIADKWIGCKHAVIVGALLNIVGNLMLISVHRPLFSLGLAAALVGSGCYKSNMSSLVGSLYIEGNAKKENAYTLYYLAINVGGTLAPLIYGAVIFFASWHLVFLCNVLAIAIGLLLFLTNLNHFPLEKLNISLKKNYYPSLAALVIIFALLMISFVFYFFSFINFVISILFLLSLVYTISVLFKYVGKVRRQLLALIVLNFFSIFYYAVGLQIGTTITLFIQQKINDGTINFHLPASTFSTLYCLFVLLLAPIMTFCWHSLKKRRIVPSPMAKLSIGLVLAAVAIAIFALAALTNFIISGTLFGYLFLSAGELVMAPAIYTAISDLAPNEMKSTMMGSWMLFIAFGGYLSSILATAVHLFAEKFPLSHSMYFTEFAIMAVFTLIIAVISMLIIPKVKRMMV